MHIAVLHGPNLNLLGTRQPELYGSDTIQDITERLDGLASELGLSLEHFQSNIEGELVDKIQSLRGKAKGILLNAAAYTHTSVALRDALLAAEVPYIEVHLSNVHAREPFRQVSLLAEHALGVISGFGTRSYSLGLRALAETLQAS